MNSAINFLFLSVPNLSIFCVYNIVIIDIFDILDAYHSGHLHPMIVTYTVVRYIKLLSFIQKY